MICATELKGPPVREPATPDQALARQSAEIHAHLRRLERRDWLLWWSVAVVNILLTAGLALVVYSMRARGTGRYNERDFESLLIGLGAAVLLFNLHVIYQQILLKATRRHLANELQSNARLETRAQDLENLATIDPLTDLSNRRAADERLRVELTRSGRHGYPLAVLVLDLDDFKQINDRHGHAAGDLVLKQFAARLKSSLRLSDLAARLGGDEFLALLPECDTAHVERVLPRIRPLEVQFRGQTIAYNFSAGSADYQPGDAAQTLLDRADQALYGNKRARKGGTVSPRANGEFVNRARTGPP